MCLVERPRIVPAGPLLPDGLASLSRHADREGIRIVSTVIERWRDGTERFDRPGESLLAALSGDEVVGIGGITRCPQVSGALRMRRFYVAPDWRRQGVAHRLASELIAGGLQHAELLTCNAGASDAAAPFWEAMGFERVEMEGITHVRRRAPAQVRHFREDLLGYVAV